MNYRQELASLSRRLDALYLRVEIMDGDDDQPRDPDGKFASNGGKQVSTQKRVPKTVEFSGNELGDMTRPIGDIAEDARQFARKKFDGQKYKATDGEEIEVTWQNIKHGLSGDANPVKAIVATKLDEIIENSELHKPVEPKRKAKARGVTAAYIYKATAVIGGRKLTVGMMIHEKADGKKYYDHFEAFER